MPARVDHGRTGAVITLVYSEMVTSKRVNVLSYAAEVTREEQTQRVCGSGD